MRLNKIVANERRGGEKRREVFLEHPFEAGWASSQHQIDVYFNQ